SNPESRFLQEIPQHLLDWRRTEPRRAASRHLSSSGGVFGRGDSGFGGGGFGGDRGRSSYSSDPTRGRNKQVHYDVGDRISHPKYGMGKAVAKEGSGATERITFDFGGKVGRVTLLTAGGLPGDKL
ncbi:ATP-dependent DNA helicase PcrA, partial [Streptomyces sp. SID10244]|nr:ATP-dependent DNA helicase PcrA [Streptomyces sp. SID10244]